MTVEEQRAAVVAEAYSWIGTPYRLGARVKGAGCDCATFIAEVLIACGLAQREDLGVYSQDWFFHDQTDRYLLRLLRHTTKTLEAVAFRSFAAAPGDVVLTRTHSSKVYSHGGVVTAWPRLVHAIAPKVEEIDASTHPLWACRHIALFTCWPQTSAAVAIPRPHDQLEQLCNSLGVDKPLDIRDRALVLIGFYTGWSGEGIATLQKNDVQFPADGSIVVRQAKILATESAGVSAVRAVRAWLDVRGAAVGPLFYSFGAQGMTTRAMSAAEVCGAANSRLGAAKLPPDFVQSFGSGAASVPIRS